MNVTCLVDVDDGDVEERYHYDPYGKVTVLDADFSLDGDGLSDFDNCVLFAGYIYDSATGLYSVRRRPYHPTVGRWLVHDPFDYPDGMNLYEYAQSQSTMRKDPMGLQTNPVQAQNQGWGGLEMPEYSDVTGLEGFAEEYGREGPWIEESRTKHVYDTKFKMVTAAATGDAKCGCFEIEKKKKEDGETEEHTVLRDTKIVENGLMRCTGECTATFYVGHDVTYRQERIEAGAGRPYVSVRRKREWEFGVLTTSGEKVLGIRYEANCPAGYELIKASASDPVCEENLRSQCRALFAKWWQEIGDEVIEKGAGIDKSRI
jgi:RHS repeat-associated protein